MNGTSCLDFLMPPVAWAAWFSWSEPGSEHNRYRTQSNTTEIAILEYTQYGSYGRVIGRIHKLWKVVPGLWVSQWNCCQITQLSLWSKIPVVCPFAWMYVCSHRVGMIPTYQCCILSTILCDVCTLSPQKNLVGGCRSNIGLLLPMLWVVVCFHSRRLTICKHSCVRHISWVFHSAISGKQTMFTNRKASALEADNN